MPSPSPPPSSPQPTPTVPELFERGRAANSAGRPAEGERLLGRAWRLLEGRARGEVPGFPSLGPQESASLEEARIRVLLSLSTAQLQRHGPDAALGTVQRAVRLVGSLPAGTAAADALQGMCRSQLAMIHGRSGQLDEALRQLDLAMRVSASLGPPEHFVLRLSRGAIRMDQGDLDGAEEDCGAAVRIAVAAGLTRQEFMARHNLALAASLRGDLPRALRLHRENDAQGVQASVAVALHGRSRTLLEAGLVQEATELLERAAVDAAQTGQRLVAGEIQVDLAHAWLLTGRADQAAEAAGRARRALRGQAAGLYRRAELVLIGARRRRGRRLGEVVERTTALAREFARDGDVVAADLARLVAAEIEVDRGRHLEAVQLLRRTADLTRVGSLSTRLRARGVLATAARAEADPATARRHLRAALLDLTEAVGASSSLELRAATHLYAEHLADLDLELAGGRARDGLLAVERWREAASRAPVVRPPADPELARRVRVLRHLRHQLVEDPVRAVTLRPRLRELERSVASLSWSAPGASGQRQAVTREDVVAGVQTAAGRSTTVVCLLVAGGRQRAIVASDGRCRVHDLGPVPAVVEAARRLAADLETCARACGGPMEQVLQVSLARSLDLLDATVLRPLDLHGRVLVVPTPALAAVPWGMLPTRRGLPTPVAPSLTSWVKAGTRVRRPRVVALSGPGLSGAEAEVGEVGRAWPGGECRPRADGDALREALATHDLVHVAAHGRHRDDSPLFSSLWLADGPYFLADLERESVRAGLVVLSACDSGRARHRGGSAALGLAAGLLSLGVGTVVAAPSRIPDGVAAEHMPRVHALLAGGTAADEALASAATDAHPLAGAFVAWGAPWQALAGGTDTPVPLRTMPG